MALTLCGLPWKHIVSKVHLRSILSGSIIKDLCRKDQEIQIAKEGMRVYLPADINPVIYAIWLHSQSLAFPEDPDYQLLLAILSPINSEELIDEPVNKTTGGHVN